MRKPQLDTLKNHLARSRCKYDNNRQSGFFLLSMRISSQTKLFWTADFPPTDDRSRKHIYIYIYIYIYYICWETCFLFSEMWFLSKKINYLLRNYDSSSKNMTYSTKRIYLHRTYGHFARPLASGVFGPSSFLVSFPWASRARKGCRPGDPAGQK